MVIGEAVLDQLREIIALAEGNRGFFGGGIKARPQVRSELGSPPVAFSRRSHANLSNDALGPWSGGFHH